MEAYASLASGAKGISGWPYNGQDPGDDPTGLDEIGGNTFDLEPAFLDYTDELDDTGRQRCFEGIISPLQNDIDYEADHTDTDIQNQFRRPYNDILIGGNTFPGI